MGVQHRERRKRIKAQLAEVIRLEDRRKYENEFGELKSRMSKAEARRRLLFRRTIIIPSVEELMEEFGKEAERDIVRAMDESVSLEMDALVMSELTSMSLTYTSP